MTDGDYKRLGCLADGCGKKIKSKDMCEKHYQRFLKYGYTGNHFLVCQCCKKQFESNSKRKFCSKVCQLRSNKGSIPKSEYDKKKREQSKWASYCMTCNAWFWRAPGGRDRKTRSFNKFCSKECAYEMSKKITAERDALLRIGIHYENKKAKEKQNAIMRVFRAIRNVAKNRRKLEIIFNLCKTCGKPVDYNLGAPKTFCSSNCQSIDEKKRPEYKERLRAYRKKRKAMKRGAKTGESFSYKQIFERDKWKCRMCGVKTPAILRGTYEPNAPELDHIMPLSKGGTHSIDNAQLLCRQCNAWKSDKVFPHQQGLFTALL